MFDKSSIANGEARMLPRVLLRMCANCNRPEMCRCKTLSGDYVCLECVSQLKD